MTGDAALTARLPEIQARADAATPGPWTHLYSGQDCPGPCVDPVLHDIEGNPAHADLTFIAHAREDVPALLFEVARLTARTVAAEKRATEAEVLHAAMKSTAGKYASEAFAAEAEVARLQGIVEKAPHPTACRSHVWNGRGWDQVEAACNCWKRDAILAAPEKEGEQ